jgi:hypothetical protein
MAIGATQDNAWVGMHRRLIGLGVAIITTHTLRGRFFVSLLGWGRRRCHINALDRLEPLCRGRYVDGPWQEYQAGQCHECSDELFHGFKNQ